MNVRRLSQRLVAAADWLPAGRALPRVAWERRHQAMVVTLAAHLPVLAAIGVAQGVDARHLAVELGLLAITLTAAWSRGFGRRARTVAAVVGLVSCSALLVHFTGGLIESHFHFFAVVALITLYQEWLPFLVAFAYVVVHHAAVGVIDTQSVYNHEAAWARPVLWAFIHGGYVILASLANLAAWRLSERERDQAHRVLDASSDGLYGVDAEGRIVFANRLVADLVGLDGQDLLGRDHHELLGHARRNGLPYAGEDCDVCAVVAATSDGAHEAAFSDRGGAGFPVEYSVRPLVERGLRRGSVVTFRDITERRSFEDELRRQALHDALTGLANRTLFLDRVEHALAKHIRADGVVAVLFIDLDDFKTVNDSLGHAAGDELLQAVASRLTTCLRPADTAARLGGDEFAVLIEGVAGTPDVTAAASRILEALALPLPLDGIDIAVSASIGVAVTRGSAPSPTLLRDADIAMYAAKTEGKGRYIVFDPSMHHRAVARLGLKADLARALDQDEFELAYQPVVQLDTGEVVGAEALLRWAHPARGLVTPLDFIPVAEETGQIVAIGRWVLYETCRQMRRWLDEDPTNTWLGAGINVSARQLADPSFIGDVAAALAAHQLEPYRLIIEVTETLLVDAEAALAALHRLKALGVQIAVDDFGTGYCSLSYLQRFPVDVVKIDKTFVGDLATDAKGATLLAGIISLAHDLNLRVVAEGVESAEQLTALTGLRADLAQGWLFAPALSAEDFTPLLRDRRFAPGRGAAAVQLPA